MSDTFSADMGESIYSFLERVKFKAYIGRCDINAIFNDITIVVGPNSGIEDLLRIYDLKCEIRRLRK